MPWGLEAGRNGRGSVRGYAAVADGCSWRGPERVGVAAARALKGTPALSPGVSLRGGAGRHAAAHRMAVASVPCTTDWDWD